MPARAEQGPAGAADPSPGRISDPGASRLARPLRVASALESAALFPVVVSLAGTALGAAIGEGAAAQTQPPRAEEGAGEKEAAAARRLQDAQVRWFTRLLSERDLPPEIRRMLIEDFTAQSAVTRHHLIRRYRAGDG